MRRLFNQTRPAFGYLAVMSTETIDLAAEVERLRAELEAMKAELTVQRLNIVEPDGTLKLVISNSARQHGGTIDGVDLKSRDGKRPAGFIYFNDEGTECGGLSWQGREQNGKPQHSVFMTMDRFRNDQAIYWSLDDAGEQWAAGFHVQDRPAESLGPVLVRYEEIAAMPDGEEKESAMAELRRTGLGKAPMRMFLGRDPEGQALLELKDGEGRPRARLSVALDGAAKLEFLDEAGAVVKSLP